MSHQLELAEAAQREGIAAVSDHNKAWLERARRIAREVCERSGTVMIDDLRSRIDPPSHPNAWGGVFRKGFVWTGEYLKSEIVSSHARPVKIWRLP